MLKSSSKTAITGTMTKPGKPDPPDRKSGVLQKVVIPSLAVGAISGIAFLLVFVFFILFVVKPDPQLPIALLFSPCYAAYFGVIVTLATASLCTLRSGRWIWRLIAIAVMPLSVLLIAQFLWTMVLSYRQAQGIPPPAVRDARVIAGDHLLSRTTFFEDGSLGAVTDIQTGDLDGQPGEEIAIVGWYGGVILGEQHRVNSRVRFEKGFSPVNVIDVEGDGTCEYLNRGGMGWQDASLIDHHGSVVWEYGGMPGVDDMAAGDIDGDGFLEFVVGFNGGGGIRLLDRNGQLRWQQPEGNVWHVEIIDADGDNQLDIVHSNAGGEIVFRDGQGAIVNRGRPESPIAHFSVCRWPTKQNEWFIVLAEDEVLLVIDPRGNTVASLNAPHCKDHGYARATPVRLLSAEQEYFAVLVQFSDWDRSILYVYDADQALVFQEILPEQCFAIAVLPVEAGHQESLLVGGPGRVWRYELRPSDANAD